MDVLFLLDFFWSVYRILSRNVEGLKLQGSNEMMFYGEIGFLGNCFIFEFFSGHRLGIRLPFIP